MNSHTLIDANLPFGGMSNPAPDATSARTGWTAGGNQIGVRALLIKAKGNREVAF